MIERILLVRSRWGAPASFPVLYHRYCGPAYRVALHLLRNPDPAEQVVRRVFMTVWRDLPGLRTPFAFRVYLYRVLMDAVQQEAASAADLPGRPHMAWLLVDQVGLTRLEAARVLGCTPRTLGEELTAGRGLREAGLPDVAHPAPPPAALWDWEQVVNTAPALKRPGVDLRDPLGWLHALTVVAVGLLLAVGLPLLVKAALRPLPVRPQPVTAKNPGIDVQSQMIKNGATSFGQSYQMFGHTFVEQNPPGKFPELAATSLIPADALAAHVPPYMLLPTITPAMTNFRVQQSGSLTRVSWVQNGSPYLLSCADDGTWPTLITNGPARNLSEITLSAAASPESKPVGISYEDALGAYMYLVRDGHLYSLFTTDRNGDPLRIMATLGGGGRGH